MSEAATKLENPLAKFEAPTLKAIAAKDLTAPAAAFLPATMAEAMELAKLMAASNFVPPHLRGKPGDCLAVVMQATRWEMDPYAVGGKTYFVQDRIAYEAQLVIAVINSRAPLVGRLEYEFTGEGNNLVCKVTGKLKGDDRPKIVVQEIATITTKNSPLWKSSPRQQLSYYTARMWARLHCPETLLGVYSPDEIQDMGILERNADGTYVQAPARPTRGEFVKATQAEDPEYMVYNESGEVTSRHARPADFAEALIEYFGQCDGRALDKAEEYHRDHVAALSDELRSEVAAAFDSAIRALNK